MSLPGAWGRRPHTFPHREALVIGSRSGAEGDYCGLKRFLKT